MPLRDLVDETLDKAEQAHGINYGQMARAIFQARLVMDPANAAAETASSSADATKSAARSAKFTGFATVALVVVEIIRLVS